MILGDKKTGLTRIADTVKMSLEASGATANAVLRLTDPFRALFDEAVSIAKQVEESSDPDFVIAAAGKIQRLLVRIPEEVTYQLASLLSSLHTASLSVVVLSCFAAEAYVNVLAHVLRDRGIQIEGEKGRAFEWLSTPKKWQKVSQSEGNKGVDLRMSPLLDLKVMFDFRNDHAHSKVVDLDDQSSKYNGRFPDPASGALDIAHSFDAANVYWSVATGVFEFLSFNRSEFERNYNLSPWLSEERRRWLHAVAVEYRAHVSAA